MRKLLGLYLLTTVVLVSGAKAQDITKIEDIVGIGAGIEKLADGTVRVDTLIPKAPAERAGLEVGDVIMKVRSLPTSTVVDVRGLSLGDVVALIRGPSGVPVELLFERGQSDLRFLSIIRERFEVDDGE